MKHMILVLISFVGLSAAAQERPYAKNLEFYRLNDLIHAANEIVTEDGTAALSVVSYEANDVENLTIEKILGQIVERECWSRCETILDEKITLKPISKLKEFPEYSIETMPNFLSDVLSKILGPGSKDKVRFYRTTFHDGMTYSADIVYIVVTDKDDKQQHQIFKIEHLQGK